MNAARSKRGHRVIRVLIARPGNGARALRALLALEDDIEVVAEVARATKVAQPWPTGRCSFGRIEMPEGMASRCGGTPEAFRNAAA